MVLFLSLCPSFNAQEHWNYFGADENLGPVAVSIRREKPEEIKDNGSQYNYRIIFRTSEVSSLWVTFICVCIEHPFEPCCVCTFL